MPGVAYGYAMHGRQFLDVAIVLYSRSGWPDDLVTCDVTGGRYLLMIIDYSVLLVSIVMVGYSGTFLFPFSFLFFFVGSVAHGPRASCDQIGIKTSVVWTHQCEDDIKTKRGMVGPYMCLLSIFPVNFKQYLAKQSCCQHFIFYILLNRSCAFPD